MMASFERSSRSSSLPGAAAAAEAEREMVDVNNFFSISIEPPLDHIDNFLRSILG
jgi:hypothetical protein